MRKLALAGMAILALGSALTPAFADSGATVVGGSAGAATGATAGFFIAGPVGAVVGGVLGAGVGAGVSSSAEDYARSHRVTSVAFDGDLQPGYRIRHGLKVYPVPSERDYSYVYVNDHPALIDNRNDTVVWVGND